jgi:NADH-quinone oxidoreductase subunit K
MTIPLSRYIVFATVLLCISIAGFFINRKNVIVLLMCIELMLLAVNTNFVAFSRFLGNPAGQVFVFFILTVAAAESAIGLAIVVLLFRNRRTINVEEIDSLKYGGEIDATSLRTMPRPPWRGQQRNRCHH